jgi:glycosyltransferase involved in cell wall biosynthesis
MKITIIGFNLGPTKAFTNGPGMSLYNFVSSIRNHSLVEVFTALPVEKEIDGVRFFSIKDVKRLRLSVREADVVHHWSGIDGRFVNIMKFAASLGRSAVCGPNVIDTVQIEKEKTYLAAANISLFLTVNDRLKYVISKQHNISTLNIKTFIVGPNLGLWAPAEERGTAGILWKGNCHHKVKDVEFGLKVRDALPQYKFLFLGHPAPYEYYEHISVAKTAKLYINTSISETKSQTLMESWASGVPSVTHPKIYMHGENYRTGIITAKTVEDYAEAISEIMENETLRKDLSMGAVYYCRENFSEKSIREQYSLLIKRIT